MGYGVAGMMRKVGVGGALGLDWIGGLDWWS